MFKKNFERLLFITFLLFTQILIGEERYDQLIFGEGLPVINSMDESDLVPGNFRMSRVVPLQGKKINLEGLADLNASGSSQFTLLGLETILKRTGASKFTLVNLRQDDVGFVEPMQGTGGIAFSYLKPFPCWIKKRTVEEIESSEQNKIGEIAEKKMLTVYGTKLSSAPADKHQLLYRVNIAVKKAFNEKQLAEEKGIGYLRFPDRKLSLMDKEQVDLFINAVKKIEKGEWLHFHCRNGCSRTTLFMIMYDMLRNADRVSAFEIIQRQGPSGLGGVDFLSLPNEGEQDYPLKKRWQNFLFQFHAYAKENRAQNFEKSWSVWAKEKQLDEPSPIALGDFYKNTQVESLLPNDSAFSQEKVLVVNGIDEPRLKVQNFRSMQDEWINPCIEFNKAGLRDIYASGSSQFTKHGLKLLLEDLKPYGRKVLIVDLRTDDYLFVNGLNVYSFETKDALLEAKTAQEIAQTRTNLKKFIESKDRVRLFAINTQYPKNTFENKFEVILKPKEIETPDELIKGLGADYLLIGNNRFTGVSDSNVDQLIAHIKKSAADTWYHFHCRKGKTRTTLFLSIFDILHNADKLSFVEVLKRQKQMGGSDLLDITPKEVNWANERNAKKQAVVFLARFHRYVLLNKKEGFKVSWSEWSQANEDYQPDVDALLTDRSITK